MFRRHFSALIVASALVLPALLSGATPATAQATEVTLFDSSGAATAYVALDDELTVYLWNGKPVAYLYDDQDGPNVLSVYSVDGRHLGWLAEGVVRDHSGYGVGFLDGATTVMTQLEPLKSLRQLKPLLGLRQLEPLRSLDSATWSQVPLGLFLTKP